MSTNNFKTLFFATLDGAMHTIHSLDYREIESGATEDATMQQACDMGAVAVGKTEADVWENIYCMAHDC